MFQDEEKRAENDTVLLTECVKKGRIKSLYTICKEGGIRVKRFFAAVLAACLVLTSCASFTMLSGEGKIDLPEESSQSFSPEFPPADEPLPIDKESSSSEEEPVSEKEEPTVSQPYFEAESSSVPASSASSQAASSSSVPVSVSSSTAPVVSVPVSSAKPSSGEVRAVWISYLEFLSHAKNVSKSQFKAWVSDMFSTAADYGLNTVYVQVRPFGDALYDSDIFPWSYVLTGSEGSDPGYDPLDIMVDCARENGLRIEAWLNPYRVRAAGSDRELSASNPAYEALKNGDRLAIKYDGGVFYNPASAEARELIADGVREILENYDVDGIHFDDYFYPTTSSAFDDEEYDEYTSNGGTLSLSDWRRKNVTLLIKEVSSTIRNTNPDATFGISPQARMDINYNAQYADIEAWADAGYMDYVCPQIYFGFDHGSYPFDDLADDWAGEVKGTGVDLYIGLAVYKIGVADSYAGSGSKEWINNDDILEQMVKYTRNMPECDGFVLYRYDSLFNPEASVKSAVKSERSNLASIL